MQAWNEEELKNCLEIVKWCWVFIGIPFVSWCFIDYFSGEILIRLKGIQRAIKRIPVENLSDN